MAEPPKPKAFQVEGAQPSPQKRGRKSAKTKSKKSSGIPKNVANRMARRIAVTTGIPTFSGMAVFVISYLLITKGIADVPPALTLLISASCFLLGLLGLSFGILSCSWESSKGSLLGFENIKPNISRMKAAFSALNETKNQEVKKVN